MTLLYIQSKNYSADRRF